jgi:rhomboid protease GluP
MGLNLILVVIVFIASCITILQTMRDPITNSRRWIPISIGLLVCTILSLLFFREQAGLISITLWSILVVVPSLGFRFSDRLYYQGNFESARRIKALLRLLHPLQDWPWQNALYRAHSLASTEKYKEAIALLQQAQDQPPTPEQACTLFYFQNNWHGLAQWWVNYPERDKLEQRIDLVRYYLRALGEIGELNQLLQAISVRYPTFNHVPLLQDYCYLYAFAFGGRPEQATKFLHSSALENMGADMRTVWLATAHCTAGNREMGCALLRPLQRTTKDGMVRVLVESRLHRCLNIADESITPENKAFLQQLERTWNEKQRMVALWH